MLKGLVLLKEGGLTTVRILCFSGQNTVIPYCCLILPIPHPFLLFRLDCIFLYLSNQFPYFLSFCYMLSFRRSYSLPPEYAHFFACQKTGTLNVVTPLPRLFHIPQFSSVQSLSHVQLFVTPWTAACQASLSITNSRRLPKLMSTESVMPSSHLILCCPLLLLPPIFPSIRVFSNESALLIRWPKYWSFSFNISPSSEHPGPISSRMDWLDLLAYSSMAAIGPVDVVSFPVPNTAGGFLQWMHNKLW